MNWGLVAWVTGALLTIYAIKFVFIAIRSLLSKDTMESVMDVMGERVNRMNKNFKKYLKNRSAKKKMLKQIEEGKPMVDIR